MSRLRAPLSSANLPIYFSSGMDYRWARPEATTAPQEGVRVGWSCGICCSLLSGGLEIDSPSQFVLTRTRRSHLL